MGGLLLVVLLVFANLKRRQRCMELQLGITGNADDLLRPQEAKEDLILEMSSKSQLTEREADRY